MAHAAEEGLDYLQAPENSWVLLEMRGDSSFFVAVAPARPLFNMVLRCLWRAEKLAFPRFPLAPLTSTQEDNLLEADSNKVV